jgi:hypothetical protein
MRLFEIKQSNFYHGSNNYLEVGTILTPRGDKYHDDYKGSDFYVALEYYRPKNKLAHKNAVFMVADEDDIDLVGGGTEYMFTVQPIGKISKHDLNWSSEISSLMADGYDIKSEEVKKAATNYWNGIPHHDDNVWEYLVPKAKIIKVEEY